MDKVCSPMDKNKIDDISLQSFLNENTKKSITRLPKLKVK